MKAKITALVMRGGREELRAFYKMLGVEFQEERHGKGPVHDTSPVDAEAVLELYPESAGRGDTLVLEVESLDNARRHLLRHGQEVEDRGRVLFLKDPEGRDVMIMQENP